MPENNEPTGTGEASPETKRGPGRPPKMDVQVPLQPPNPENINWVGPEESERLETIIEKHFVRKTELKSGDNKKYYYEVQGAHPYVPAGVVTTSKQSLVLLDVQKFYRNKFASKNSVVGGIQKEVKVNIAAEWVATDPKTGDYEVVDADASFQIDSREFEKLFVRDDK